MSSLDNSLINPLLGFCLLLCHTMCTYWGMTPPTSPPHPREKKRFTLSDYVSRNSILIQVTATTKLVFCIIGAAETFTLARQLTSSPSPFHPVVAWNATTIGSILSILGATIRLWCHHSLGRQFTWDLALIDNHRLITTGPYAYVRHPAYSAWVPMIIGNLIILFYCSSSADSCAMSFALTGALTVVPMGIALYLTFLTYTLLARVKMEDAVLRQQFGKQWDIWAQKTPYALIPLIY